MVRQRREVRAAFQRIRRDFYPRWDRKRRWRLSIVEDLHGACGLADPNTKTISIRKLDGEARPEDSLELLLIHEIAHAVTNDGHGKKWLARMRAAAKRADDIGRPTAAQFLREEADAYEASPREGVRDVYARVEAVVWDAPQLSFDVVAEAVGREFGFSLQEIRRRCTRLREFYDEAQSERAAYEEGQARFLARAGRDG